MSSQTGFFGNSNCFLETQPNEFQGILGLAFAPLLAPNTDAAIIALNLNEFTLQLCNLGGNMWMRRQDNNFISAPFQYTPIISDSFYVVSVGSIIVNTTLIGSSVNAIVDSGTTEIVLPSAMFNAFANVVYNNVAFQTAFNNNRNFFSNGQCFSTAFSTAQLNAQLPSWNLTFTNGVTLTLLPVESYLLLFEFDGTTPVYCPGIASTSSFMILGYGFINQFTTRFDIINNQIGFAPTQNCGTIAQPFPFYAVTQWSDCNTTLSQTRGTQFGLNFTCVFPNLTATNDPSLCAIQTKSATQFCSAPTSSSSSSSSSSSGSFSSSQLTSSTGLNSSSSSGVSSSPPSVSLSASEIATIVASAVLAFLIIVLTVWLLCKSAPRPVAGHRRRV
jgi:hypothetical protein